MLVANHVADNIVIENPNNKLNYWVQEKRVLADLLRNNPNSEVQLVYLPIMKAPQVSEVTTSISNSSNPMHSLPLSVAMESVAMPQQIPTQATKPKSKRSKSKKPTSIVSQKTTIVTSKITLEGSVKEAVSGEGRGEHQVNPQNKVGELSEV